MVGCDTGFTRGLDALRLALAEVVGRGFGPGLVPALTVGVPRPAAGWADRMLLAEAAIEALPDAEPVRGDGAGLGFHDDSALAASSEADSLEGQRLIALVELARKGDAEAFGSLYDHYQPSVYRFLYYRLGSVATAEDLTSETFFRALRSMSSFRWQGKDFGAWLMTIARNLTTDHFKSGRARLELTTEDMTPHDSATEGPESAVLASLTNEALLAALGKLPAEQQECLIMRFLQGLSIAETAHALGRSEGAVKQLQLRAVRNLAKLLPEGLR